MGSVIYVIGCRYQIGFHFYLHEDWLVVHVSNGEVAITDKKGCEYR